MTGLTARTASAMSSRVPNSVKRARSRRGSRARAIRQAASSRLSSTTPSPCGAAMCATTDSGGGVGESVLPPSSFTSRSRWSCPSSTGKRPPQTSISHGSNSASVLCEPVTWRRRIPAPSVAALFANRSTA